MPVSFAAVFIPLFVACMVCREAHGHETPATSRQRRENLEDRARFLRDTVENLSDQFENHLAKISPRDQRDELVTGLGWAQFRSELASPMPEINSLRAFSKRLYEPLDLVDLQAVVELRSSIDRYTDLLRVLRDPDLESEIERRQRAIESLVISPGRLDTVRLGEHLDWLTTAGVKVRIDAVRRNHSQPNIRLDIPKTFANLQLEQFQQDVEQSQYVTNVVLGTPISGVVHTNGVATASLLPDNNAAGFVINLRGVIDAPNNVAVRNPVTVYSSGRTDFTASTNVVWDGLSLKLAETSVVCRTSSEITGVAVHRQPLLPAGYVNRIIARAAWRRAEQQRPLGESVASRMAETRLEEAFSAQARDSIEKLNGQFQELVARPLRQVGMLPSIGTKINPEAIHVSLLQPGPGKLAGTAPPKWQAGTNEFVLYFHESALTSFFRQSAGGAVWTDRKFAKLQKALLGDNSYEFRIGLHPRWQTTLNWSRPLATRFNQHSIVIQMNAESLKIENTEYPYPYTVEATYVFETIPPSLGFARVGDMRFAWTGKERPAPADEPMLSSFIHRKFSGWLLEKLYLDGLRAPSGGGLWGKLGGFTVIDADSENGWMLLKFAPAGEQ